MIISLVSEWNRIRKTEVAKLARNRLRFRMASFAGPLRSAAKEFIEDSIGKNHEHPYLHVTRSQIVNAIAKALDELHHELPVHLVKKKIEALVERGYPIVIDDTRRQSEFLWLDDLAYKHGTVHLVIEIIYVPGAAGSLITPTLDVWSNGREPCGKAAWPEERTPLFNDGTPAFWNEAIGIVGRLAKLEKKRLIELVK